MAPKQANLAVESTGTIVLSPGNNFEQALQDLNGFERIWIVYWFHKNAGWKVKVSTPRGGPKRGVFSTRSPHRPNPIGLSCVELVAIKGRELTIGKSDLIDGTPILDIKPYLNYADAFPKSKQGWIEEVPQKDYKVTFSPLAKRQIAFIESRWDFPFKDTIELRLKGNPYPLKNNRIKPLDNDTFELAVKTWRIHYTIKNERISIKNIVSGYDSETLAGRKPTRWNDLPLHQEYERMKGNI